MDRGEALNKEGWFRAFFAFLTFINVVYISLPVGGFRLSVHEYREI